MDRQAPESGYTFGNKKQYRREVWAKFRSAFGGQTAEKQAALLPSIEGEEIEVALRNGFRQANLHVIDRNPAIVATLKRRFPYITTYGVTASQAVARMIKNGVKLDCANWDLCGPLLSEGMLEEVKDCLRPEVYQPINLLAVTVMKGRDTPKYYAIARGAFRTLMAHEGTGYEREEVDGVRSFTLIQLAVAGCRATRHSELVGSTPLRTYTSSSGVPMAFMLMQRHLQPCPCRVCQQLQHEPLWKLSDHLEEFVGQCRAYTTRRGTSVDLGLVLAKRS